MPRIERGIVGQIEDAIVEEQHSLERDRLKADDVGIEQSVECSSHETILPGGTFHERASSAERTQANRRGPARQ